MIRIALLSIFLAVAAHAQLPFNVSIMSPAQPSLVTWNGQPALALYGWGGNGFLATWPAGSSFTAVRIEVVAVAAIAWGGSAWACEQGLDVSVAGGRLANQLTGGANTFGQMRDPALFVGTNPWPAPPVIPTPESLAAGGRWYWGVRYGSNTCYAYAPRLVLMICTVRLG